MTDEEDRFDELLRSKLSEREFFFDELNWEKAETKLKRREQIRSLKRYAGVFLGGLMLGAIIMYPLVNKLKNGAINKVSGQPLLATDTRDDNLNKPANNSSSSSTNNFAGNKIRPINSAPVALKEQVKSTRDDNAHIASLNVNSIHRKAIPISSVPVTNAKKNAGQKITGIANTPSPAPFSTSTTENNTTQNSVTQPLNEQLLNSQPALTAVKENNISATSQTLTDKSASSSSKQQNGAPIANATNNTTHYDGLNNVSSGVQPQSISTSAANPAGNIKETISSSNNNMNNQKNNKTQNNSTDITEPVAITDTGKNEPAPTASNANPNKDFMSQAADYAHAHHDSYIVSIEAGAAYGLGWALPFASSTNTNGTKAGEGITPVAGFRLTHDLNSKFAISSGLRFYMLSNVNASLQNSNTTYDFGLNSLITTITANSLYYLSLPVDLEYNFGNQDNLISLGVSVLYLINSSGTLTTTSVDGVNPPTTENRTVYGYTDGFNSLDMQPEISYRRKIFGGFYVGFEGYFGLIPVENSAFFDPLAKSSSLDRNSGARFILSYNINQ